MLPESALTLLINGLTLALALSFAIVMLWYDPSRELSQFFAVFLGLVFLWNIGSFLTQISAFAVMPGEVPALPMLLLEFGFTGSSVALYALVAALVKVYTRRFRLLVLLALAVLLAYRLLLAAAGAPLPFVVEAQGALRLEERGALLFFYLIFNGVALFLLWRNRRKIRLRSLKLGLLAFIIGQSFGFLNPELETFALATMVSSLSALGIGLGILQQEIIRPLAERNTEVDAIRQVVLSIAGQTALDEVLARLAADAARLVDADGAAIFLKDGDALRLRTTYELAVPGPEEACGEGMAQEAARTGQFLQVDDYARGWKGPPDFAYAPRYFGAVMCAPLVAGDAPVGALMVVASRQGRLFDREDAYLLQLLAAQAVVAITQSMLIGEQTALTLRVEQSRGQLEAVLSSTESPVIAVDRGFRLVFANPAARELFHGQIPAERTPIGELLPAGAFPSDPRAALRTLRRDRTLQYEAQIGERIYSCHAAALGGQRMVDGWVAVLSDITQLKELDRLKSEMVRMTSHDLKNPLQGAMVNLDLLRDDVYDTGSSEVQMSIDTIDRQLQRMHRIIRGILDLERLRDGVMVLEFASPARIISEAAAEMGQFAADNGIVLTACADESLPHVACDVDQFGRALVNLVENAVKFTPRGGHVRVEAQAAGGEVVFSVSDTGIGISAEQQQRIFERFYRANQRGAEHISGTGLGLNLVKTIVASHRGRVWVESEVGHGTRFLIALPRAQPGDRG
jgi:signal transduction histidine kinase